MSGEAHKLQNDNKQKGGISNYGGSSETESGTNTNPINNVGSEQSEGGQLLQKADVNNDGKDSDSARKNCSTLRRRFFRKNRM